MSQLLEFIQTHEEPFRSRIRLASLYSDFGSQRSTNPDGFNANAHAWLHALNAAADAGFIPSPTADRYVLHTGEQLARSLNTKEHGRPLALGAVVDDAVRKKQLAPLNDFLEAKTSISSSSWIPTPWQVVQWGLRQLGVSGSPSDNPRLAEGDLVMMANVEAASQSILSAASPLLTSPASRIFSRDLFTQTFAPSLGHDTLSPNDYSVLLTHLSRDLGAVAFDRKTGVAKFLDPSERVHGVAPSPSMITPEDRSIGALRTLIAQLETQTASLATRVSDLDASARAAVTSHRLTAAKSALRQKKAAEATLARRSADLANLEAVFADLEQAADQVQMVDVLRDAGRALKSLNARTGGVEAVQEVMEGVREETMNVEEIAAALQETAVGEVDEGEVEEELERLERGEQEKERERVEATKQTERTEMEAKKKVETDAETEETRRKLAELKMLDTPKGELAEENVGAMSTENPT